MLSAGKGNLVHCKRHEAVSDVQAVSCSMGMPVRGDQQPAVQQQAQHAQPAQLLQATVCFFKLLTGSQGAWRCHQLADIDTLMHWHHIMPCRSMSEDSDGGLRSGSVHKSRFRGVSYDKKKRKWRVQIKVRASTGQVQNRRKRLSLRCL